MKYDEIVAAWDAQKVRFHTWETLPDRERIEFALSLAGKVEKQEPVAYLFRDMNSGGRNGCLKVCHITPCDGAFPVYTAPQPCPECEERKTTALNYISLTFEFEQLQSKSEKLKALSVTNILIDVVPGDGSGLEIYAKSVSDVEALLSRLGEKAEDYDLLKPKYEKLKAERDELAAQVTHWKANHASVVAQARILKERPDMPIERVKAYENWVAMAAQVEKMLNPADVLLEIVGRIQPFALPREEDTQQKRYERLRKAYCIAQPWPIPDQACLVWRADLMHMAGDLVHKQAYFDNEKRKRDSALAAYTEAGK